MCREGLVFGIHYIVSFENIQKSTKPPLKKARSHPFIETLVILAVNVWIFKIFLIIFRGSFLL